MVGVEVIPHLGIPRQESLGPAHGQKKLAAMAFVVACAEQRIFIGRIGGAPAATPAPVAGIICFSVHWIKTVGPVKVPDGTKLKLAAVDGVEIHAFRMIQLLIACYVETHHIAHQRLEVYIIPHFVATVLYCGLHGVEPVLARLHPVCRHCVVLRHVRILDTHRQTV